MTNDRDERSRRTAVILGASEGIGLGCAQKLASAGHRVVMFSRSGEKLVEAARSVEGEAHTVAGDLASAEQLDALFERVNREWGGCDILVNNNGGPPPGDVLSLDEAAWTRVVQTHALPVFRAIKTAVPTMIERHWGRIVTIASVAVKQPIENLDLSNFVRGGLAAVHKPLSRKLAEHGISVHLICPGAILTTRSTERIQARANSMGIGFAESLEISEKNVPMGRLGTPEDVGALVEFLCSDRAAYLTGNVIQVDGGMTTGLF
ncbi:MAG: SDR family oxidoreductase [Myxococcota bacterium]|nr:SDR family oxidoreductase [Myxococcota bacterium]